MSFRETRCKKLMLAVFCTALYAGASLSSIPAYAAPAQSFQTEKVPVALETVIGGLENPWSLAFLPDGKMLVSERPGRLRVVDGNDTLSKPLTGVPAVFSSGQGGLLDVVLDPGFSSNRLIYFSFAEDRGDGHNGTSVARAHLKEDLSGIDDVKIIFRQQPGYTGRNHFGSRLVFDREGMLFVTLGERFDLRQEAQNPANHLGKIVRIRPEGGAAPGNPFIDQSGKQPEIWSIGHRNVQGAALNPATGELWTAEHGARGGDEINIPRKGRNYGWPVISYGVNYSGSKIGEGVAKAGMEQPIYYWDPSIAPSGMIFYTGDRFPQWRGNIFVGGLAGSLVSRLEIDNDQITHEERILQGTGHRFRDIRQGPDGNIYLLTDESDGMLLRLKPAN